MVQYTSRTDSNIPPPKTRLTMSSLIHLSYIYKWKAVTATKPLLKVIFIAPGYCNKITNMESGLATLCVVESELATLSAYCNSSVKSVNITLQL